MLRREGPQRWVYEENVLAEDMGWRFLQETNPTDYVQGLCCTMLPQFGVERGHILKSGMMTPDWDPAKIGALLEEMTAGRCMFSILSTAYGRAKGAAEEGEGERARMAPRLTLMVTRTR